jgi:hypothetical protein
VEKSFLEKVMLYTGCYCVETLFSLVPLVLAVGLYIDAQSWSIIAFTVGVILFIVVSTIFFWKYSQKYKDEFFKVLKEKGIKQTKVDCKDVEIISLPSPKDHCPFYKKYGDYFNLKTRAPMAFEINFIYLCPDSITFYSNCAKYHLVKDDVKVVKKGFRKVRTKKDTCADIFEIYYYNIMYINYEDNKIMFHLVDGSKWGYPVAKAKAGAIIKSMRTSLRKVMQRKTMHKYEKPFVVSVKKHKPADG